MINIEVTKSQVVVDTGHGQLKALVSATGKPHGMAYTGKPNGLFACFNALRSYVDGDSQSAFVVEHH